MFVRDTFDHVLPLIATVTAGQDAGAAEGSGGGASSSPAPSAGREAGDQGVDPSPSSEPLTLDAVRTLLEERDRAAEKRFKRINDELARARRGTRSETDGEGQDQRQEPSTGGDSGPVTRDDLRAERQVMRALATLEAEGLDVEQLEEIETAMDSMTASQRLDYVNALKRGLELGRKGSSKSVTGDREVGTGTSRSNGPRGRAEPPRARVPSVSIPTTWPEYEALPKTDPARKAALDKLPVEVFDPIELRKTWVREHSGRDPIVRQR